MNVSQLVHGLVEPGHALEIGRRGPCRQEGDIGAAEHLVQLRGAHAAQGLCDLTLLVAQAGTAERGLETVPGCDKVACGCFWVNSLYG